MKALETGRQAASRVPELRKICCWFPQPTLWCMRGPCLFSPFTKWVSGMKCQAWSPDSFKPISPQQISYNIIPYSTATKISYQRGWEHRLEHTFQVGLTFWLSGHLCKKLKSSVNHFTHQYNKGANSYVLVLLCRLSELYLEKTQNRVSAWKAHVSVVINTLITSRCKQAKDCCGQQGQHRFSSSRCHFCRFTQVDNELFAPKKESPATLSSPNHGFLLFQPPEDHHLKMKGLFMCT